jgi:hypothetical protein
LSSFINAGCIVQRVTDKNGLNCEKSVIYQFWRQPVEVSILKKYINGQLVERVKRKTTTNTTWEEDYFEKVITYDTLTGKRLRIEYYQNYRKKFGNHDFNSNSSSTIDKSQ